ncbi:MAG TPA: NADP-dependent oxidoreductase [Puia sp.]
MKAILLNNYGPAEDLRFQDTPTPAPSVEQVLVKIHATAVNHIDIGKAAGAFRNVFPLKFPWIPGYDFAGVIEAVGAQVQGFKMGDEVYGTSLDGGTYAEYIAINPEIIALKPRTLNFTEAASVPVSAETAEQVLFRHANVQKGQRILIHGGAGAVGTYAVQMAHQAGLEVLVTASLKDKAFLEGLGADEVLDYKDEPFESIVSHLDAVIDLVGGDVQQRSYQVIKEGGILISVNQPVSAELAAKYKIHAVFSELQPSHEGLSRIAGLIDSSALKINMGAVYPIRQAAEAWNDLQGKRASKGEKKNGRVVLQINRLLGS